MELTCGIISLISNSGCWGHAPVVEHNGLPPECAFCAFLRHCSVATAAIPYSQVSQLDSQLRNQGKPKKNKKKTTTLCLRHSGPVGLLGFLVFLFLFVFFCFFFFGFLILHEEHFAVLSLLTLPFPIIPHHERSGHAYTQPHLWISSKCVCFLDFLTVWAPSQKLT